MKDSYTGSVQCKNGLLYVVIYTKKIVDGKEKPSRDYIPTKLKDNIQNREQAEDLLSMYLFQYSNGQIPEDRKVTMGVYVEHYIEDSKRNWADTTYSGYLYRGKYITAYFNDVPIRNITTQNINDFYDYLLTEGRIKKDSACGKKGLSVKTVTDVKELLNKILCRAKNDNIVSINPAENATINRKLQREKEYEKEDDLFFDCEECMRFLQLCKGHELYELFYVTMCYGLRRSEVLGLKWQNINLEKKEMYINSTVTKGTKVNHEDSVKSKSSRRCCPLSETQCDMFRQIKERQINNMKLFGEEYINSDYVFTHRNGATYYPDYPTKAFKKILKKDLTLPQQMHFHGLRASCVSLLYAQGFQLKEIQDWVGHADLETTLKYYTKIKTKESKKEILNKMDALLTV